MKNLLLFFILLTSCNEDPVTPPPSLPPDSTSHNILWQIDTLGTFQSFLYDAWGIDANNFWAVGFLYLDSIPGSNIAHWNGANWRYENIFEGDLFGITGFAESDVWAVGDWYGAPTITGTGSYIVNWNGTNWEINKLNFEGLRAIWGTSSQSLYAVGHKGTILHFDGSTWVTMYSGTSLGIVDIWGTSDIDIYAVGGDETIGKGILLHYDGSGWEIIYERTYLDEEPSGYFSTIWGIANDKYYLNAGSGEYSGKDTVWQSIYAPTDNTYLETIRGDSDKNIFFVGDFGLIVHWNGKSWNRYDEFFRKPGGDLLFGAWVKDEDVFIVGRSAKGARGIVYRGKMVY